MTANRKITIRDVAERVGVSASTVSRALNVHTRDLIMPETVERVLQVARDLGYQPNRFAYALKKRKSFAVGVLIPNLQDPLFPPIIRGIEHVFNRSGYTAVVANTDDDAAQEAVALERLRRLAVDGFIVATALRRDVVVEECLRQGAPLVLVNRTVDSLDVDEVVTDDGAGVRAAIEHLISLGHRRIAHVAGPQDLSTGYSRCRAFMSCVRDLGLEHDDGLIEVAASFRLLEGQVACARLLARRNDFTAIVAGNDLLALGCIDVLRERSLDCPRDVSVVGHNDMPMVDRMPPPLTTLAIPHYEMGAEAARSVIERIDNPAGARRAVLLRPKLIVRKSTAPAKPAGGETQKATA